MNQSQSNASAIGSMKLCPACKQPQKHDPKMALFACQNIDCNHECLSTDLLSPPDSFESHRVLARYAEQCNVTFTVAGQPMPHSAVFMPELFLPVIIAHGYRIWQRMAFNDGEQDDTKSFGAVVHDCSDALFGVSANCAPIKHGEIASTLRLLALTKAAEEVLLIERDKQIQLDEFIDQFQKLDWEQGLPQIKLTRSLMGEHFRGLPWYEHSVKHNDILVTELDSSEDTSQEVTAPVRQVNK